MLNSKFSMMNLILMKNQSNLIFLINKSVLYAKQKQETYKLSNYYKK